MRPAVWAASNSGELSQELEEEPHRYEDAAEDTNPDYTTPSGVGDGTTDHGAADATTDDGGAQMAANRRGNGRTSARMCSAPSGRNLLK